MHKVKYIDYQVRYTVYDTINYQYMLKEKILDLIYDNRPLRLGIEKQEFYQMISKACLSQGIYKNCVFIIDKGRFTFASIQNFALRIAEECNTSRIKLTTKKPDPIEIIIPISQLWRILIEKLLVIYPHAVSEAYHMSAEAIKGNKTLPVLYSSKREIKKVDESDV